MAAPGSKHADWMPILPKIVPEVIKRLPLKVAAIALAGIVASGVLAVYFVPQLLGLNGGLAERGPLAGLTTSGMLMFTTIANMAGDQAIASLGQNPR